MSVNLDTRRSVLSDLIECSFMRMFAHPNCKYLVFNIVQGTNCLVVRFLFELWEYPTGITFSPRRHFSIPAYNSVAVTRLYAAFPISDFDLLTSAFCFAAAISVLPISHFCF